MSEDDLMSEMSLVWMLPLFYKQSSIHFFPQHEGNFVTIHQGRRTNRQIISVFLFRAEPRPELTVSCFLSPGCWESSGSEPSTRGMSSSSSKNRSLTLQVRARSYVCASCTGAVMKSKPLCRTHFCRTGFGEQRKDKAVYFLNSINTATAWGVNCWFYIPFQHIQ